MSKDTDNKFVDVRPLNDEDVENIIRKLANADQDELHKIFNTYVLAIKAILTAACRKIDKDWKNHEDYVDESDIVELERIKRLINLIPAEEMIIRSKDKVWNVRQHIADSDEAFFLNRDYSSIIKKDGNQAFIEAIIGIIKGSFKRLTKEEKDFYWLKANIMLNCVSKLKLILGEFSS